MRQTDPVPDQTEPVGRRLVYHGDELVATIYGELNDVLYVPPHMDWRSIAWPQLDGQDRYVRVRTVEHGSLTPDEKRQS